MCSIATTVRKTKGDTPKTNSFTLLKRVEFYNTDKLHGQKLLFTEYFTNSEQQWENELLTAEVKANAAP